MDFGLSEEQELLQETVRGFAEGECPPNRLRELFDAGAGGAPELWRGLGDMGVLGLVVAEQHGGAGLELLEAALVAEVLGEAALPSPFLGHTLACLAIAAGGSPAQRERFGPGLASGEITGTVALAESETSWLPESFAARVESGALDGRKLYVPHAADADVFVVGTAGGGLALVEKGAAGLSVEPGDALDRTRPLSTLELSGAAADPLPEADAERLLDAGLVLLAADALGGAWRLLRMTLEHVAERKQFGTALGQFQAVKHQIADLATDIEPARALVWYAAHAWDRHLPDARRAAAQAKAHLTDRAMDTARGAFELHGGIGYTWECDVQFWFKRAQWNRAFLGGPELHRARNAELCGW